MNSIQQKLLGLAVSYWIANGQPRDRTNVFRQTLTNLPSAIWAPEYHNVIRIPDCDEFVQVQFIYHNGRYKSRAFNVFVNGSIEEGDLS